MNLQRPDIKHRGAIIAAISTAHSQAYIPLRLSSPSLSLSLSLSLFKLSMDWEGGREGGMIAEKDGGRAGFGGSDGREG